MFISLKCTYRYVLHNSLALNSSNSYFLLSQSSFPGMEDSGWHFYYHKFSLPLIGTLMLPSTPVVGRIPFFSITLRNAREKEEGATLSWKPFVMLNWRSYSCLCSQHTIHGKDEVCCADAAVTVQPPAAAPKMGNLPHRCKIHET